MKILTYGGVAAVWWELDGSKSTTPDEFDSRYISAQLSNIQLRTTGYLSIIKTIDVSVILFY